MSFIHAKNIVSDVLEKYGITEKNYFVIEVWEKEFFDINKHIKLIGIKDDSIILEIDSSVANNEVRIRKKEILNRINKYFLKEEFKNIKVLPKKPSHNCTK